MKIIHASVMANDNAKAETDKAPMSDFGQQMFDMMNDMNNRFVREFCRDEKKDSER
jgi:hypothetical protein